jgi:serine/threonine protein phosphatase PrpC
MTDAKCYLNAQMSAVEPHVLAGGRAVVFSRRSPTKETHNEDAAAVFRLDDDSAVLVVADGLGGGPAGERASALAVAALQHALQNVAGSGELLRTAILDGIEAANQHILATEPDAATTLAVVEIHLGRARTYHVGDSSVMAVSQRGRLKFQTVSHSPVGYAVEAGVLNAAEAMHHEARHVVSNVVGCPKMRIEMGPLVKLRPRDTVVLASDGLFDNLHTEEIVEIVRKGDLIHGVEQLVRASLIRMTQPGGPEPSKPDDLTIVAFRPSLP